MQHAHDDYFGGGNEVIGAVAVFDNDAQARAHMIARRTRLGKIQRFVETRQNIADYAARGFIRGFADQIGDNFGDIRAGALGQPE